MESPAPKPVEDRASPSPTTGTDSNPPPILPEVPEGTLLWRLFGIVRQMRPEQWVKNAFVLAPWVFSKQMNHPAIVVSALGAFGVFCLLASSIYTINDLVDLEADRVHPKKRKRPLASGRVPV